MVISIMMSIFGLRIKEDRMKKAIKKTCVVLLLFALLASQVAASYTDVIRIRATKIGSFRKKYACTQKKKPEAAMRPRLSASEQLGYFAKKYV